jgi:tight adherence protein C
MRAQLLAATAGFAAAGAIVDLAALLAARPQRRRRIPARWAAPVAALGRRIGVPQAPESLAARVQAAGLPHGIEPADVMAAKIGAAAVGSLLAAPAATSLPLRGALIALAVGAVGGFLVPDLWLARRERVRLRRAGLELADVLDLLRVAVEAGLPAVRALAEVGRRHRGVVGGELAATASRIQLGMTVAESLALLRARLPLPEVAALTAALERAARHGAPLGPTLAAQATEARSERARRLRERAARAAPRIQLAVALLLVPAVLLVIGAMLVPRLGV